MLELISIKRVVLAAHHSQPKRVGAAIHAGGTTRPAPPFVGLQIAHYPGEKSCYLFHIPEHGEGTDTFHESIEEALAHAEQLYGVVKSEWDDVNLPFGSDEHC
jgi:hypothetical protein